MSRAALFWTSAFRVEPGTHHPIALISINTLSPTHQPNHLHSSYEMVNAAKVLQDLRASAERKPDVVVRLGKPLVESGAVMKLDADGK